VCGGAELCRRPSTLAKGGRGACFAFAPPSSPLYLALPKYFSVGADETAHDSDDSDDSQEWTSALANRQLDDFEDVDYEEKVLMMMWNAHVRGHPIYADSQLANACLRFCQDRGDDILKHKLRRQLVVHLLNLWDAALVDSECIANCMQIVDSFAHQTPKSAAAADPAPEVSNQDTASASS